MSENYIHAIEVGTEEVPIKLNHSLGEDADGYDVKVSSLGSSFSISSIGGDGIDYFRVSPGLHDNNYITMGTPYGGRMSMDVHGTINMSARDAHILMDSYENESIEISYDTNSVEVSKDSVSLTGNLDFYGENFRCHNSNNRLNLFLEEGSKASMVIGHNSISMPGFLLSPYASGEIFKLSNRNGTTIMSFDETTRSACITEPNITIKGSNITIGSEYGTENISIKQGSDKIQLNNQGIVMDADAVNLNTNTVNFNADKSSVKFNGDEFKLLCDNYSGNEVIQIHSTKYSIQLQHAAKYDGPYAKVYVTDGSASVGWGEDGTYYGGLYVRNRSHSVISGGEDDYVRLCLCDGTERPSGATKIYYPDNRIDLHRHSTLISLTYLDGYKDMFNNPEYTKHETGIYVGDRHTRLFHTTYYSTDVDNENPAIYSQRYIVIDESDIYASEGISTSGQGLTELFEWEDGNPEIDDRIGVFITLRGEFISVATTSDDYIVGVVDPTPYLIGGEHDSWPKKYLTDAFGRILYENVQVETGEGEPEKWVSMPKVNPDYDATLPYIRRQNRPEYAAITSKGKVVMIDDGTCVPGKFATVGEGGIATHSDDNIAVRVLSRVDENHVRVYIDSVFSVKH